MWDTSNTAGRQCITVNVNVHTSPANHNVDLNSSANASGQANGKRFTPCINKLSKGVSFPDDNTEKSDINSYNNMNENESRLPAQKGFSTHFTV
eukprot:6178966-Ditylum_brightwellii.AAC.1